MTATPETPAKPCLHKHGDRRRYSARPCHPKCVCEPCRASDRRYYAARRALQQAGQPLMVPATDARERLQSWRDAGAGTQTMAKATGLPQRTIYRILNGRTSNLQTLTADIILNAPSPVTHLVDPTKTVRQLEALSVAGFSMAIVAAGTGGGERSRLSRLIRPGRKPRLLTRDVADRVNSYFEDHYADVGPSRSAALRAAARGLLPFEAWTDETISDPAAKPWGHVPDARWDVDPVKVWRASFQPGAFLLKEVTPAEREQVVVRLIQQALSPERVAEFTGWSPRTVTRICADIRGRGTLAEYLLRLKLKHQARAAQASTVEERADARTSLADLADLAAHVAELAGQGVAA